jgi:hypothetical protein
MSTASTRTSTGTWPRRWRTRTRAALVAVVAATSLAAGPAPAQAGSTIPSLPQLNADNNTPRVVDDSVVPDAGVRELRQVGTTMYVGGAFNRVSNSTGTATYTRRHLFSFNANTGAMTGFSFLVNGPVYAMEPTPDGHYLFVGGDFSSFDGKAVNRLVKINLATGRVDTNFTSPIVASRISDLQIVNGLLYVAGIFPGGMAALNYITGARTTYLDGVAATGAETGYSTRVYRFAVNPAQDRMVVIGSFTAIGGQPRQQAAMVRLGGSAATVSPWSSPQWTAECSTAALWFTRDVDWSPDGSYFAIVTTGAPHYPALCDTITRWNYTAASGTSAGTETETQQPAWINYSGGDTFHSVAVTNRGVFASGHFRWLDNPAGVDSEGPGAVDRLGLGLVDATTGRALPWNPGKTLEGGLGGFDLYFTARGLWVGHFERGLGTPRELHPGVGLLPY